ncbi:hypothetical protein [Burkholderia sp. Ac-20365]|jgi:hypothetical protein|uniref:hypothetical protein n=1 Tax=Burkholderia sp. Ac-20365 TaxID=2703897 RepID=UPI00197BDAC8|nr:hypothetical protein [Burkholderia sp. Ac-20365]MBN3764998.1 hypothetical protein [Burkholderia sp. Ac-20365]
MKFQIHMRNVLQALHRMSADCFTLPDNATIARYCFNACAPDFRNGTTGFKQAHNPLLLTAQYKRNFFLAFFLRALPASRQRAPCRKA